MMMMFQVLYVLAETKNRSRSPYTFRKVRTLRGCLEVLARPEESLPESNEMIDETEDWKGMMLFIGT